MLGLTRILENLWFCGERHPPPLRSSMVVTRLVKAVLVRVFDDSPPALASGALVRLAFPGRGFQNRCDRHGQNGDRLDQRFAVGAHAGVHQLAHDARVAAGNVPQAGVGAGLRMGLGPAIKGLLNAGQPTTDGGCWTWLCCRQNRQMVGIGLEYARIGRTASGGWLAGRIGHRRAVAREGIKHWRHKSGSSRRGGRLCDGVGARPKDGGGAHGELSKTGRALEPWWACTARMNRY